MNICILSDSSASHNSSNCFNLHIKHSWQQTEGQFNEINLNVQCDRWTKLVFKIYFQGLFVSRPMDFRMKQTKASVKDEEEVLQWEIRNHREDNKVIKMIWKRTMHYVIIIITKTLTIINERWHAHDDPYFDYYRVPACITQQYTFCPRTWSDHIFHRWPMSDLSLLIHIFITRSTEWIQILNYH